MEPAEPDHKRIKRRQTVWIAYLQTKERPNSVASGSRVQMRALSRRHNPAVALSGDLLGARDATFSGTIFHYY